MRVGGGGGDVKYNSNKRMFPVVTCSYNRDSAKKKASALQKGWASRLVHNNEN